MANEFELSPKELKRQADALLAAADAAEKAAEREPAARSAKKSTRKKGEETAQEAPAVMTDEEARKAGHPPAGRQAGGCAARSLLADEQRKTAGTAGPR